MTMRTLAADSAFFRNSSDAVRLSLNTTGSADDQSIEELPELIIRALNG